MLAAATTAGAVNSIAGGGSLITFPLLVWLGRAPILANATNTISLSPGSLAPAFPPSGVYTEPADRMRPVCVQLRKL